VAEVESRGVESGGSEDRAQKGPRCVNSPACVWDVFCVGVVTAVGRRWKVGGSGGGQGSREIRGVTAACDYNCVEIKRKELETPRLSNRSHLHAPDKPRLYFSIRAVFA